MTLKLKLKEWACDQIAEAFRDHLEGDYYSGSERVNIHYPESELTSVLDVMLRADIMWEKVDMPDISYFKVRNMIIRDLSIDGDGATLDDLFIPAIDIDQAKTDLVKSFIKLFA